MLLFYVGQWLTQIILYIYIYIIFKYIWDWLTQNKKAQQNQYWSMVMFFKRIALWYSLLHDSICDSVSQFDDGANKKREGTTYLKVTN